MKVLTEARKVLEDGIWHGTAEFCAEMCPKISPEKAYRTYQRELAKREKVGELPFEQAVAWGRRYIVTCALYKLKYTTGVSIRGEGMNREYKMNGVTNAEASR